MNETPENYPIQFKDRLDEYLWKEHQILGGCCSSIENLKYYIAREVAEKLTDAFMEKAIKYIANHFLAPGMDNEIKEFVNYMKGE